jgi:hypothetical protein
MINNAYGSGPRPLKPGTPKSSFEDSPMPSSRNRMPNTPVPEPNVAKRGTIKSQSPPPPEPPPARRVVQPHADGPAKPVGPGTGESQPAARPGQGRGKTLPGSLKKPGAPLDPRKTPDPEVPLPSNFPKKSGTPLTIEQVYQGIRARKVGWSMTSTEHAAQWRAAHPGSKEEPPMAFTTSDGRVQVDEERWIRSGQPAIWGTRTQDRISNPPPPPDKE